MNSSYNLSANWNDTEIFPAAKNARTVLTDAFLSDVNNTTPSQIVNWLMDFDYNLMKNGFAHSQEKFKNKNLSKPYITYLQKLKKMREGSLGGFGTLGMCHFVDVPVDACAILGKRLEKFKS